MYVKSISVSLSQKINLGNYESKGIIIGATADLDESDDLQEAKKELAQKLNKLLEEEVNREKSFVVAASR